MRLPPPLYIIFTLFYSVIATAETANPIAPHSIENSRIFIQPQVQPTIPVRLCFTPGEQCDVQIVDDIAQAKDTIEVQAYHLTAPVIVEALQQAQERCVLIRIILDGKTPVPAILVQTSLPLWLDKMPGIAHNKVMIIDKKVVYTGSYNFSKAAEKRNAENLIRIEDVNIAASYLKNWHKRFLKAKFFARESIITSNN